jgi:hypothetical protein
MWRKEGGGEGRAPCRRRGGQRREFSTGRRTSLSLSASSSPLLLREYLICVALFVFKQKRKHISADFVLLRVVGASLARCTQLRVWSGAHVREHSLLPVRGVIITAGEVVVNREERSHTHHWRHTPLLRHRGASATEQRRKKNPNYCTRVYVPYQDGSFFFLYCAARRQNQSVCGYHAMYVSGHKHAHCCGRKKKKKNSTSWRAFTAIFAFFGLLRHTLVSSSACV